MSQDNKGKAIGFWIATGVVVLGFLGGGVLDIISGPEVIELFTGLGYPTYLPRFLGVAKILGLIAILAPGFLRLKEWAYAGMVIDLTGATYSHIANGDGITMIAPPVVVLAFVVASYALRPDERKLPDPPPAQSSAQ